MKYIIQRTEYFVLLRRGHKVYVGKVDDLEVDFVVKNTDGLKYYQVALTVRKEKVSKRELKLLRKIGNYNPKVSQK